jgi:hypothetical protein
LSVYIISYDLNGNRPTHAEMDEHLKKKYASRQRILETVWFVCSSGTIASVYEHANAILSGNDRLIVIEASNGVWRNVLGGDQALLTKWNACSG